MNDKYQKHPVAEVLVKRGSFVESKHAAHVVICDQDQKIVEVYGDENLLTSPRSAIKMLQLIPFITTGAYLHFKLSEKFLSLGSASHQGEKFHTDLVEEWMNLTGFSEDCFICGSHEPMSADAASELKKQGLRPSAKHNNCSGKHSAMISTSLFLKENEKEYYKYDSKNQKRVRDILSATSNVDLDKAPWGIDGCGIPTYAYPLKNITYGFSHFLNGHKSEWHQALQLIQKGVGHYPFLVEGTKSMTSLVIEKTGGNVIVKVGAEGFYCGAVLDKGICFSIKIMDGHFRASTACLLSFLRTRNYISEEMYQDIKTQSYPIVKNWKGEVVGEIETRWPS